MHFVWCYLFVLEVHVYYWCISSAVINCFRSHRSKPFALWLLSCRTSSEIDDKAVESFVDEDDFIISLDYNAQNGVCSIVLETSSWRMVAGSFATFRTSQDEGHSLQVKFVRILLKLTWSGLLGELSDIQLKLRKTVRIVFFVQESVLAVLSLLKK